MTPKVDAGGADRVLEHALIFPGPGPCVPESLPRRLVAHDFSEPFNWLDGTTSSVLEFNGDWVVNAGQAALPAAWAQTKPVTSGFAEYVDLCPTATATITATAWIDTSQYTDPLSDATLVLYFFDALGNPLAIVPTYALHRPNHRTLRLDDVAVPPNTRRIAIVPMVKMEANETAVVYYDDLVVDYRPTPPTRVVLAQDDFSAFDAAKQAAGWTDVSGEWFVMENDAFLTLWNPAFGGGALPLLAETSRTFALSGATQLTAELFAAATFTDDESYFRVRLTFDDGSTVDGLPLRGTSWSRIDLHNVAVPQTATAVTVRFEAFLGSAETSSFYVDDLALVSTAP